MRRDGRDQTKEDEAGLQAVMAICSRGKVLVEVERWI